MAGYNAQVQNRGGQCFLTFEEMQTALTKHRNEITLMVGISPAEKSRRFRDDMPVNLAAMFDPLYTTDN